MGNSIENSNESINLNICNNCNLECKFESPVDINVINTERIELPELIWTNYDNIPEKMKLVNSGETLILVAEWNENTPYIRGGPLQEDYVFSRIHFHWGPSALNGSEHTVDGISVPLEMHVIHFKRAYTKLENAIRSADGLMILVYFFELKSNHNPVLDRLLSQLPKIQLFSTEVAIKPFIITELMKPFQSDFFLYNGSITTKPISTPVLWFITRKVTAISPEQLCLFQQLMKSNMVPIHGNCRKANPCKDQKVFYVNPPHRFVNSTLSPIPILYKQQFE